MELRNRGDYDESITEFRKLFERHEGYAAAYFHLGQAFEKVGEAEQARAVYEKAWGLRRKAMRTRAEIEAALPMLAA